MSEHSNVCNTYLNYLCDCGAKEANAAQPADRCHCGQVWLKSGVANWSIGDEHHTRQECLSGATPLVSKDASREIKSAYCKCGMFSLATDEERRWVARKEHGRDRCALKLNTDESTFMDHSQPAPKLPKIEVRSEKNEHLGLRWERVLRAVARTILAELDK